VQIICKCKFVLFSGGPNRASHFLVTFTIVVVRPYTIKTVFLAPQVSTAYSIGAWLSIWISGCVLSNFFKITIPLTVFCRVMLCKHGLCRHAVSVRVSVMFVDHVKTNKHIKLFSPSGSHAILVFPCQTA